MNLADNSFAVAVIYVARFFTIILGFAFAGALTHTVYKKPDYRIFPTFTRPEKVLYAMLLIYSAGICGVLYTFGAFNRPVIGLSSIIPLLHCVVLSMGFWYLRELSIQASDARYESLIKGQAVATSKLGRQEVINPKEDK